LKEKISLLNSAILFVWPPKYLILHESTFCGGKLFCGFLVTF
jgi:hypothetical protein